MNNTAIKYFQENKIRYINFYDYNLNNNILTDDIHLNYEGGVSYSKIISDYIKTIDFYNYNFKLSDEIFNFNSVKIEKIIEDKIDIKINGEILGILNTIGPSSPIVEIHNSEGLIREESIWDRHCAYDRKHFNFKNIVSNKPITIKISNKNPEYHMCKNENVNFKNYKKNLVIHEIFYTGNINL